MNTTETSFPAPEEVSDAYRFAAEREAERVAQGAVVVGRKVGYTNRQTWQKIGATAPMWGAMYDDTVVDIGDGQFRYSTARFNGPRIEPEIVVHFHKAPSLGATAEDLLDCIDWMAQGYEIVVTPLDGKAPTVPQAIMQGGMHGSLLIGAMRPVAELGDDLVARLAEITVELRCDGELKEVGSGANVLGNPLNAILHLMEGLEREGRPPLKAGEIVTTGTLTAAYHVSPGQRWTTTLQGVALPDLDVTFEV